MTGRKEYEPSKNGCCGTASINGNIVQFKADERGYIQSIKVGDQEFVPKENTKEPREEKKMDFSRFVGIDGEGIFIFGDKGNLISERCDSFTDIIYTKHTDCRDKYDGIPDYEVVNAEELEQGDVFIADDIDDPEIEDFFVAVGKRNGGTHMLGQNLVHDGNIEYIWSDVFEMDERVKRFKRECVTKSTNPFRRWMQRCESMRCDSQNMSYTNERGEEE